MSDLIIGLTGGIASGKTTVADLFAQHFAIDIVDADIVAREVVAPNSPALIEIAQHFGSQLINDDGSLDRSKLRQLVFSDQANKQWLNALLHPMIRTQISLQLSQTSSAYCLLVAPLLLENSMQSMVDVVLVVDSEEQAQVARTMARDNSDEQQIKSIMAAQIDRQQRLQQADDIIKNIGTINGLTNDIKKLHHKYTRLAKEGSGKT
ncbi:MAG: dephospho-CoA kinase [Gammaproteobacteria bacterium]|nr:dephospho-CoA kinase [Gammaproteobacteria bacterium]